MENEYAKQAQEFLNATGTQLDIVFDALRPHFAGDTRKDQRDVYRVTMTRGRRSYSFDFGQSFNCSGTALLKSRYKANDKYPHVVYTVGPLDKDYDRHPRVAPTAYDILAGLGLCYSEDFDDFIAEYGYAIASKKDYERALATFDACLDQSTQLQILFNDDELDLLAEIN